MIVLGLCVVIASLLLSGAISGAASALRESTPQSLQQPTLTFLTEYDTADYLGISLNELDYIRSEGILDGAFIAVTSLEQTGEETYADYEDGVEVIKTRPVMSNVTRFLFNRQLLDEKMTEAIRNGNHINPYRSKSQNQDKKQGGKKNKNNGGEKPAGNFGNPGGKENNGGSSNGAKKDGGKQRPVVQVFGQPDEDTGDTKPAENTVAEGSAAEIVSPKGQSKPAAAGPPKPMGPIGDSDDGSDNEASGVIDIMSQINNAGKNGSRNGNGPRNHGGNGGGGHGSGNGSNN